MNLFKLSPELNERVNAHLRSDALKEPFFVAYGKSEDATELYDIASGSKFMLFSDPGNWRGDDLDLAPDPNLFIARIRKVCEETPNAQIGAFGLGEFLAFKGENTTKSVLGTLEHKVFPNGGKVVFFLRGVVKFLRARADADPRFRMRYFELPDADVNLEVNIYSPEIKLKPDDLSGNKRIARNIREGIRMFEHGLSTVSVQTRIQPGDDKLGSVKINAFTDQREYLCDRYPDFPLRNVPSAALDAEGWKALARELGKEKSFPKLFKAHNVPENLDQNAEGLLRAGREDGALTQALRFFRLCAAGRGSALDGKPYLKRVLDSARSASEFCERYVDAILDIPVDDPGYRAEYDERKKTLKNAGTALPPEFLRETNRDPETAVFRLTDVAVPERERILAWFAPDDPQTAAARVRRLLDADPANDFLRSIYPDFTAYMSPDPRVWDSLPIARRELFEQYFEQYLLQKAANHIDEGFETSSESHAADVAGYFSLQTRENLLNPHRGDARTLLFWLDALGTEFAPFILRLCDELELDCDVELCRGDLPTITEVNKGFYDDWEGPKETSKELDDVKHDKVEFRGETGYIARELDVVRATVEKIKQLLKDERCDRVLLVSDHGATRMAVLKGQEEKIDAGEKGAHSGRCCEFEPGTTLPDIPGTVAANNWLVMTNYARFAGSRRAEVEAHGGATLEEAVLPFFTISLRESRQVLVEIRNTGGKVERDQKTKKALLQIFVNTSVPVGRLKIEITGESLKTPAVREVDPAADGEHYELDVAFLGKKGKYRCRFLAGTKKLGDSEFEYEPGRLGGADNSNFDL